MKNENYLRLAFEIVNQNYVFNSTNYLGLFNISEPKEVKNFALKHSLLHMQKHITLLRKLETRDVSFEGQYERVLVKMLTNFLKIAEIVGITVEELEQTKEGSKKEFLHEIYETLMYLVAVECENFDHNGSFTANELSLKDFALDCWSYILYNSTVESKQWKTLKQVLVKVKIFMEKN